MSDGARYPREVLEAIARLAEADPEHEVCGLVVRWREGSVEAVPVPNVAGQGPGGSGRSARDGFVMDPRVQLRVLRELARTGGAVLAVYHSHPDAGPELSATDQEGALIGGRPALPGAEQLVFAMRGGRVTGVGWHAFDGRSFQRLAWR